MAPSSKRRITLSSVAVDLGCGGCKRPRLFDVFSPSGSKRIFSRSYSSSASSCAKATPSSHSKSTPAPATRGPLESPVSGFGRVGGNSVAVEKETADPYIDFRQSMLQMIVEKKIYSGEELKELLNCFLQLNSPYYHGVIVRAFADIWNSMFSSSSSS